MRQCTILHKEKLFKTEYEQNILTLERRKYKDTDSELVASWGWRWVQRLIISRHG